MVTGSLGQPLWKARVGRVGGGWESDRPWPLHGRCMAGGEGRAQVGGPPGHLQRGLCKARQSLPVSQETSSNMAAPTARQGDTAPKREAPSHQQSATVPLGRPTLLVGGPGPVSPPPRPSIPSKSGGAAQTIQRAER